MRLAPINSQFLEPVWHKLKPYVKKALAHSDGKLSVESVFNDCMKGNYLAWMVYNADKVTGCFITELLQYPCSRRLNILLLSADSFEDVAEYLEKFKFWAKRHDVDAIECYGRPGWEKRLQKHGFEKIHTLLRMDLNDVSKECRAENN